MKNEWQVIVGNVGTVYEGTNGFQAITEFNEYVNQSKNGYGRAAFEPVTLIKNGEEHKTHYCLKILSIDAWGNEDGGYDWNNWWTVGHITNTEFSRLNTDKKVLSYMRRAGYITTGNKRLPRVDDDQYNLVIVDAKTDCPLFAIEYGSEI